MKKKLLIGAMLILGISCTNFEDGYKRANERVEKEQEIPFEIERKIVEFEREGLEIATYGGGIGISGDISRQKEAYLEMEELLEKSNISQSEKEYLENKLDSYYRGNYLVQLIELKQILSKIN